VLKSPDMPGIREMNLNKRYIGLINLCTVLVGGRMMMITGTYDNIRDLVSGETMIAIRTSERAPSGLKTWTKLSLLTVTIIDYL
jgi:hypothetical protein